MSIKQSSRRKQAAKRAAAALLVLSLVSGCSFLPNEEEPLQPPLVKPVQEKFDTIVVEKGTIQKVFTGVGSIVSSKSQPLFYKDSGGRLKAVHIKLGQQVKKGDLIAELEVGDLNTQIRLQKLNLERTQIEYIRAKNSGAADLELRLSSINLERERINLESIQERYNKSRLVASMDGIVTYLSEISPGDGITGYQPIASIDDPNFIELVYEATTSNELSSIQVNMKATVEFNGEQYPAKILQTPSSAPITGNKELEERNSKRLIIDFDAPKESLQIGGQANITMPLEKHDDVIVIPRSGLRSYLGRDYVQILDGERRKEVDVEIGLKTSTEVEIRKGVEVGQQVILKN
ncbi:efflux RND transporter periplasmic adaptor subunit [Cohnella sp.]|uniref:efflux RND transporter periplasmic adaptor subunit n=1 Tax=Cohnella sp. TaxID=1883426 RepID=UPI0035698D12